jgi:cytochrome c5
VGEMPARGQCEACTDDEIRAAVAYMLEQVQ